jgi:DNA-directed RNA polymerase subunit RPC12/RpoP
MVQEPVEYKCAICGSFESFRPATNGMHCKKCGARIFVKPRRTSYKELDAI